MMTEQGTEEEDFYDALETFSVPTAMDLHSSIEHAKVSVNYFLNNMYLEAKNDIEPWVKSSMYHSLVHSFMAFTEGILTFEDSLLAEALNSSKSFVGLSNSFRKKTTIGGFLGKMVRKTNYNNYTPLEIHAELCYAEGLLIKSLLTFLEDETLGSFIKGGLQVKNCYGTYKECFNMLSHRQWENDDKIHFESGVRFGLGAFNVMISLLPPRVIKLMEFIGFSGDRTYGLQELERSYRIPFGFRSSISGLALLAYHLIIEPNLCHVESGLDVCNDILQSELQLYPKGVLFLYFKGRSEIVQGNVDEAMKWYVESWKSQDIWKRFHDICFWELFWCHCYKFEWLNALNFMNFLLQGNLWSTTIYAYHKAVTLLMLKENLSLDQKKEVDSLMTLAYKSKQLIAGKSIPIEKFITRKCTRYFSQEKQLVLPVLEMFYMWNLFKIIGKNELLMHNTFNMIETTIKNLNEQKLLPKYSADNRGLLLLLKGASLHQLQRIPQAEQCLHEVVSLEKQIIDDSYLVPFAIVELAHIYVNQRDFHKATQYLTRAKKNYSDYCMEARLIFQIHSLESAVHGSAAASS